MVWAVNYTESAKKQLHKLDKQMALRILDFMDARIVTQDNPRSVGKALTGPMLGAYWRYRVGDHRIICDIQDGALCVLVIEIGNRSDIYR